MDDFGHILWLNGGGPDPYALLNIVRKIPGVISLQDHATCRDSNFEWGRYVVTQRRRTADVKEELLKMRGTKFRVNGAYIDSVSEAGPHYKPYQRQLLLPNLQMA